MDLSSICQLCSFTVAHQLREKKKRRGAQLRRLAPENLEPRTMFDATSDFNSAIAAAQAVYQGDVTSENAIFQSTEQSDASTLAGQAQTVGQTLQSDVNTDDQTLQSTSNTAQSTMQSQDAASDQTDSALWPFPYLAPGDNIPGRRPTVWSASSGPTFSPPQFVEPVTGGVVVTYTQVETITPREFLTTMTSWQNIQYAFKTWWQGGW